jgi:primosomal protein N' (replication factor Y)
VAAVAGPEPTPEQRAAVDAVIAALGSFQCHLLYGVTGSGKTEVYLRVIEAVARRGEQTLLLVPEINLTPQLEARFAERFGSGPAPRRIVSLHSGLTPAQRLKNWLAAHLGLADLVLGTRMAVFAPLPRLGLIVVDEEHDPSYKQQEGARYSARDLAVYRGKLEGACVVLGSATPSLESWQRAEQGRYERLTLAHRVGDGALPTVRLIDMTLLPRAPGVTTLLSPQLVGALAKRVEAGEQSLVFLNRRGYAPVLHCGACGWKSACPHCSAWRVFHKLDRTLRCHHCGFTQAVPRACPDCGNLDIAPLGRGTERLEEQLAEALPGARVARIDADSTRAKGALEAQLSAVHAGEVDVLVGTQMIAKGHDFRRITLVAAVSPDNALFSSDFRAPERLFSLLMQAAGRAGRDAAQADRSEMLVQTWHPTHPLYTALRRHDYAAFAASQLKEREMAGLPPFTHLALLRAEARTAQAAREFLQAAAELAGQLSGANELLIYPPVPHHVARVANVERMQMLVESPARGTLQRVLRPWVDELTQLRSQHKGVLRWALDVDPLAI